MIAPQLCASLPRLNMMLVLCILILCQPLPVEGNLRLCGSRLTKTLMALCKNRLCGGFAMVKRPVVSEWSEESPTMRPMSPMQSLHPFHHAVKRAGIATECCERRCSFNYLKTFCCD